MQAPVATNKQTPARHKIVFIFHGILKLSISLTSKVMMMLLMIMLMISFTHESLKSFPRTKAPQIRMNPPNVAYANPIVRAVKNTRIRLLLAGSSIKPIQTTAII